MGIGLDEIKQRLTRFAEVEAADSSPLYAHLAAKAAEDDEVAGLLEGHRRVRRARTCCSPRRTG